MLSYNELRKGTFILVEKEPWIVEEFEFLRMQQRKPVAKVKLRNLITGRVQERTFHQNESVEEVELEKLPARYLYESRGTYWFDEVGNPKNRMSFEKEAIADSIPFLKANLEVKMVKFGDRIISVELPVKVEYTVTMAPPAIKGNTAQGGSKVVTLETGAEISVPLFVNEGDIIRINTETKEYVERVGK